MDSTVRNAARPIDHPRAGRSRRLLWLAIVSSAMIVAISSVLMVSFFAAAPRSTAARPSGTLSTGGEPLTVALARTPGGSLEWRTYADAIGRMGEAVGRPMRIRYVDSRSGMADLLLSGEVDAAFLCTYCYLRVAGEPGVSLVAAPVIAGHANDAAVLVVREDSDYAALPQLRGRRIGVTDPTSLAGHAYLLWLAEAHDLEAAGAFTLVTRDSQEQSIRALLAGDVEAVVVNRSQLASWRRTGIRVIETSPEFGMPPFVTGATVDAATSRLMRAALVSMRPAAQRASTTIEGFTVPEDDDYAFARTLERHVRRPGGPE